MAFLTNPGNPPIKYEEEVLNSDTFPDSESNIVVIEFKKTERTPRYCRHCNNYKPPRSHHCSECNACILKMDHHCPWVGHCIGFRNQPYFYRFLMYVSFSTFTGLLFLLKRIYNLVKMEKSIQNSHKHFRNPNYGNVKFYYTKTTDSIELIFIIINFLLLFFVFLSVFILFLYQTNYISSGMTTIETFEKEKIEELVLRGKIRKEDAIFPYNLGTSYKNFREIFNSSEIVFFWFLFTTPKGNGLKFKINEKLIKSSIDEKLEKEGYFNNSKEYVYYWPPQEYLNYKLEQNFGIKSERSFKQDINEKKFNLENRKKRNYNRNGNEGLDVLENTLEERNNELEHSLGNTGSPLVTNDVIGFEYDSEEDNEVLGLLKKRILQK